MADLGDRGQLILVTGVSLAVALVVLTVVLNAAVHTESLSTAESADDASALEYRADAAAATLDLLAYTNGHDDGSYAALRGALAARVGNWSRLTAAHGAVAGGDRRVSLLAATNGTRVEQTNDTRAFVAADGDANWTVVPGATGVRDFAATVSRSSLAAPTDARNASALADAGAFTVVVDGAERRRVFLYRDGTDVVVRVANASGLSAPCRAPAGTDDRVRVSFTNASVGESDCAPLTFFESAAGPFDLRFARADDASGTFALVADRPRSAVDDADLAPPGSGAPSATPVLFDATVRVSYATPSLAYATTVRVVPGERDA